MIIVPFGTTPTIIYSIIISCIAIHMPTANWHVKIIIQKLALTCNIHNNNLLLLLLGNYRGITLTLLSVVGKVKSLMIVWSSI